jgi:hypothetical protein
MRTKRTALVFEPATTLNTGNACNERAVPPLDRL